MFISKAIESIQWLKKSVPEFVEDEKWNNVKDEYPEMFWPIEIMLDKIKEIEDKWGDSTELKQQLKEYKQNYVVSSFLWNDIEKQLKQALKTQDIQFNFNEKFNTITLKPLYEWIILDIDKTQKTQLIGTPLIPVE